MNNFALFAWLWSFILVTGWLAWIRYTLGEILTEMKKRKRRRLMASERQIKLMEMPSGLRIIQQFTSVEFMFETEDDAEKFFICVSESFRMGTPFTIRPDRSGA